MKKLVVLVLCIVYTALLLGGCKQSVENPPAETTEPSVAETESISETIKPNTGPIITTSPTEPISTTESPSTPQVPVELYLHYVQAALSYMDARWETLMSGDTTALSEIAISGIVNDEVKHREYLIDNNIAIPEVTYTVDKVKTVDEHGAYVVLRELNTLASVEVSHILLITRKEKGLPFVISDEYKEDHTGFVSASYVPNGMWNLTN